MIRGGSWGNGRETSLTITPLEEVDGTTTYKKCRVLVVLSVMSYHCSGVIANSSE
jgi:hypothetical protein